MASGTIFAGSAIKTLKQTLSLNGIVSVASGSADPSSGFSAPVGSIYLRTDGSFYIKTGALDTNWTLGILTGGSASFLDSSFEIKDDVDPTKIMKFQVSGVSPSTTRTYSAPDKNGTLAVGSYNSGQVVFWEGSGTLSLFSNTSSSATSSMPTGFPGLYHGGEFTTSTAGLASGGTVRLQKLGATGTFVVELYSFSGGLPGTLLASSSPIDAAAAVLEVPGESDVPFTFGTPVSLLSGTQYYLVINVTGITSGFSTLFYFYQAGAQARARSQDGSSWFTTTPAGLIRASVTQVTVGSGLDSEAALSPIRGGTGVSNNAANTISFSGAFSLALTLSANASLTLPTTGTLATLAGSEGLSNKAITASNASLTFMSVPAGSGGAAGWMQLGRQSAVPSTPTASVRIFNDSDDNISWMLPDGHSRKISSSLSASRNWTFPDFSGTVALLERVQTFSAIQTFSAVPVAHGGIRLGTPNTISLLPPGSVTTYSLELPGVAPTSFYDSLTYTGGSAPHVLSWKQPGELSYLAGEAIASHDVLYIAKAGDGGRTVGRVYKADASNALRSTVIGIAIEAQGTIGNPVRVQTVGEKTGFSVSGTVGEPAYLSDVTPGLVSITPSPAFVGLFSAANTVSLNIAPVSASSITSLNGLGASVQSFAVGTSGTDFNIASSVSTHTFNIPNASPTARGLVSTATQSFVGIKDYADKVEFKEGMSVPQVLDFSGTLTILTGETRIVGKLEIAAATTIQVDAGGNLVCVGTISGPGILSGPGTVTSI